MSLRRQIWVVLLSYLTRTGFRWAAVGLISGFGLMLIGVGCGHMLSLRPGDENPFFALIGIGAITIEISPIAALIVFFAHARQQLMGPNTRFMPNTRPANLIVAGTLFFAVAAVISIPGYYDTNFFLPAFFLVVLGVMTLIACAVCNPWLAPIPFIVMLLATYNRSVQQCLFTVIHDNHWKELVAPNKVIAALWEEHARYQSALRVILLLGNVLGLLALERLSRPKTASLSPIRVFSWISAFFERGPVALPEHRHPLIDTQFARSLHRRFAIHDWRAAGFLVALMAADTCLLCYLNGTSDPVLPITALLAVAPGALAAAGWRDRWKSYDYETLYPVRHQQFVSELLLVVLLDSAEFWIASFLAVLLPLTAMRATMLHDPRFWAAIMASGMLQLLWIGGIVAAGQRRQTLPFAVALGLLALSMVATFGSLWRVAPGAFPSRFMAIATIEMLVGLLFLTVAMFAWRRRPSV